MSSKAPLVYDLFTFYINQKKKSPNVLKGYGPVLKNKNEIIYRNNFSQKNQKKNLRISPLFAVCL